MRIVVAGASGLIGSALTQALDSRGHEVHTLVRHTPRSEREHEWDPAAGVIDDEVLRSADALISLGGDSVGKLPWTKSYRDTLWRSRIDTTQTLARAIKRLGDDAPDAWLSASAVGYYGSRPGEPLTEVDTAGDTFLARLCAAWEADALAVSPVTRVTLLRTAPVVHPEGVLKPMITLTRFGLGGPLGKGTQWWPWISLTDEVNGIIHALDHRLEGPVNLTGPTLATQSDIGRALSKAMKRPFLIPAPEFALNLALGRDATESLLTADARVLPQALTESGFIFTHETPSEAISEAV